MAADWKIILVVLLGLFLISLGLFTEMGFSLGNFGEDIIENIGKSFPFKMMNVPEEKNIKINGEFEVKELDLKSLPLEEIKITYEPNKQYNDIMLSDTKLSTEEKTEILIKGYNGLFKINNSMAKIIGDAEETTVNGVKFETIKRLIPVNFESINFQNIYINKLDMNKIELNNALGNIELQNKLKIRLANEPLIIEGFSGGLNITENIFKINGMVRKVSVSGNDYTATIS